MPLFLTIVLLLSFVDLGKCEEETIISALEARLAKLEKRDENLASIIEQQRQTIYRLQMKHSSLNMEHDLLKTKVTSLERKDKDKTELISKQTQELEEIKHILKSRNIQTYGNIPPSALMGQVNENGRLHQERNQKRFIMDGAETVAFQKTKL